MTTIDSGADAPALAGIHHLKLPVSDLGDLSQLRGRGTVTVRLARGALQFAFVIGDFRNLAVFGLNGLLILVVVPEKVSPGS